jgi:type I restriction enzyme, S subunit
MKWNPDKLSDICQEDRHIIEPNSIKAKQLPYLSLDDIEANTGKINLDFTKAMNTGKSTSFEFTENHILYGKLRPYLNKVALPEIRGRCTTELIPILPKNVALREFLAIVLRRKETVNAAMKEKTGSRMPRANMDSIFQLRIYLPPLEEQKRIVAILNEQLSEVEKARKAAELQIKATSALNSAYLREIFNTPEAKTWNQRPLGEICDIKGGKRLPKGTDFCKDTTPFPYIRVLDFQRGTVNSKGVKYINENTHAQIARYIIRKEDVYISIAGSIGIVGTIPRALDGANLTENAAKLVIKDKNTLARDYLATYLQSSLGQDLIIKRTNKVGQPKLALERIATISVPIPPFSEQINIVNAVNEKTMTAYSILSVLNENLGLINKLPSAILQRAFSGAI